MSFLKIVGLLLLAMSFTLGGVRRGSGYHRRVSSLEDARALMQFLHGQLAFTLAPPAALLQSAADDPAFSRLDYLIAACKTSGSGQDVQWAWNEAVQKSQQPFSEEDRAQLSRLGEILGKSDLDTQLSQLTLLADRLGQQARQAREEAATKARLSTTLGALCGLAVVILFC